MSVHHRQSIRSVNHLYDEEEETLRSIHRQRRRRKEQRQLERQKILLSIRVPLVAPDPIPIHVVAPVSIVRV